MNNTNAMLNTFITTIPDAALLSNIQSVVAYTSPNNQTSISISGQSNGIGIVRTETTGIVNGLIALTGSSALLQTSTTDYTAGVSYWGTNKGDIVSCLIFQFSNFMTNLKWGVDPSEYV